MKDFQRTCDNCGLSQGLDISDATLNREKIKKALQCLADNGIDKDECPIVLQALCYILMDTEIEVLLLEEDYEN